MSVTDLIRMEFAFSVLIPSDLQKGNNKNHWVAFSNHLSDISVSRKKEHIIALVELAATLRSYIGVCRKITSIIDLIVFDQTWGHECHFCHIMYLVQRSVCYI